MSAEMVDVKCGFCRTVIADPSCNACPKCATPLRRKREARSAVYYVRIIAVCVVAFAVVAIVLLTR